MGFRPGRIVRRFFSHAFEYGPSLTEVTTDRAPTYPRVLDDLLLAAGHATEQYSNNPIDADHGRLKSRLRPMRGLKRLRSARIISSGHASIQTSAEATTNSAWMLTRDTGYQRPSPNSRSPSNTASPQLKPVSFGQHNTALCRAFDQFGQVIDFVGTETLDTPRAVLNFVLHHRDPVVTCRVQFRRSGSWVVFRR
jgi:hypothetical protein